MDSEELKNVDWSQNLGIILEAHLNCQKYEKIFSNIKNYCNQKKLKNEFYNAISILVTKGFFVKLEEKDLRDMIKFYKQKNQMRVIKNFNKRKLLI